MLVSGKLLKGEHRGHDLGLGLRIPFEQRDLRAVRKVKGVGQPARMAEQAVGEILHGSLILLQVLRPGAAPVGRIHPAQERWNHLPQLRQHHLGIGACLREWMGPHPEQQRFVGLASAIDAHV